MIKRKRSAPRGSWRAFNNKRLIQQRRLGAAYYRGIRKVFGKFPRIPGVKEIEKILKAEAGKASIISYKTALVNGFNDVEAAYGGKLPISKMVNIEKISFGDLATLGIPTDQKLINEIGMVDVKTVAKSRQAEMRAAHASAIEAGGSVTEALQAAKVGLESQAGYVARRIAQTESTRIYAAGSLDSYEKSTVAKGKGWSSNMSGNVRQPPESEFNHAAANGEEVAPDKPFVMTGEELMYPGDPNGSAGNVINCHCGTYPVIRKAG